MSPKERRHTSQKPTAGPRRRRSASTFLPVRCNGVLIQQVGNVCAEAHPFCDKVGLWGLEFSLPTFLQAKKATRLQNGWLGLTKSASA